jgi:hypothetical protein
VPTYIVLHLGIDKRHSGLSTRRAASGQGFKVVWAGEEGKEGDDLPMGVGMLCYMGGGGETGLKRGQRNRQAYILVSRTGY